MHRDFSIDNSFPALAVLEQSPSGMLRAKHYGTSWRVRPLYPYPGLRLAAGQTVWLIEREGTTVLVVPND